LRSALFSAGLEGESGGCEVTENAAVEANQPFLDRLRPASRERLLSVGFTRKYQPGELAIGEGQLLREVLIVRAGRLDITKGTPDGREMVIAQRGPGHLVGELSAIDSLPRTASAWALIDVSVTVIPDRTFFEVVSADPELARALLAHLAARVRQTSDGLLEFGVSDGTSRVCRHLVELAEVQAGGDDQGWPGLRLEIGSQERFSLAVGLHRSSLVKILGHLREIGVVDTGRGTVTILDPERLRTLV